MNPGPPEIDRVTTSVLSTSFPAITEEMHRNLIRSAYSTIVRESRDASTALLTVGGELLAQGRSTIPVLLNAFGPIMTELAQRGLLTGAGEGEAFITNDPYGGGQHLDDIALVVPVFSNGSLLGYAGAMAHHIDVGAAEPGLNPLARTIRQEGIRLPPMRIVLDRDLAAGGVLAQLLGANIRVPDQTLGDIRAQIAAAKTGAQRLRELADRHGTHTVAAAMQAQLDYAETMMRYATAEVPDGVYTADEWLDDVGGDGRERLRIRLAVTVDGDCVHVDLAGTSAQTTSPINSPLGSTVSSVTTAVAMLFGGDSVPVNAGSQRVLTVDVPRGSLLNPLEPAPVSARMSACFKVFDALLTAMSGPMPDAVIAPSYSAVAAIALSHQTPDGHTHIYREALGGGYGAGEGYDGADGTAITLTNTANVPTEFAEQTFDYFRVEHYALHTPGSGEGSGRHRGGRGVEKAYRILTGGVQFAAYSDHHHSGPDGLAGGLSGAPARFVVERDGQQIELPPLILSTLAAGDLLRVSTAGGGGFGPHDPQENG